MHNTIPTLPDDETALNIVNDFRRTVTTEALSVCQSCDLLTPPNLVAEVSLSDSCIKAFNWNKKTSFGINPSFRPVQDLQGNPLLLHEKYQANATVTNMVSLCKRCFDAARKSKPEKMPFMALANGCWTGNREFGLSFLEEMLITVNHVKGVILQITGSGVHQTRGNFVILPNDSGITFSRLPVSWEYLPQVLKVVLGPGWKKQSLVEHLTVRKDAVLSALSFLKQHSPAYKSIEIAFGHIPECSVPEVVIEHCCSEHNESNDFDMVDHLQNFNAEEPAKSISTSVSEVPSEASEARLRKEYLELRSLNEAQPDFFNPEIWDSSFPTIFPFGSRSTLRSKATASAKEEWLTHQLRKSKPTARRHATYLFYLRDVRNRLKTARQASALVKKDDFPKESFSESCIRDIIAQMKKDEDKRAQHAKKIIRAARYATFPCVGSDGWSLGNRERLYAMNFRHGRPTLWITLNFNPKEASYGIYTGTKDTSDGVMIALYIDHMWKSFLSRLTPLLGGCKAHFAQVESQGSGGLHIHLLLWCTTETNWVEKRDNSPDALRSYIDRIIHQSHSEATEKELLGAYDMSYDFLDLCTSVEKSIIKDKILYNGPNNFNSLEEVHQFGKFVASLVQKHTHSFTCYKIRSNKFPLKMSKQCRFNFPALLQDVTKLDPLVVKRDHPLVNAYNTKILAALRCNMDIKPIMVNTEAKSLVYYICNYTTKSDTAHNALKAISQAYEAQLRTESWSPKGFLNRAANRLVRMQETSKPLAAFHTLFETDYYTSDEFVSVSLEGVMKWATEGKHSLDKTVNLFHGWNEQLPKWVDYWLREDRLADVSLYGFLTKFEKRARYGSKTSGYTFKVQHPQSKSHIVVSTRQRTLFFKGRSFPSPNDPEHQKFKRLLFLPWRDVPNVENTTELNNMTITCFEDELVYQNLCDFLTLIPTGYQMITGAGLEEASEDQTEDTNALLTGPEQELEASFVDQEVQIQISKHERHLEECIRKIEAIPLEKVEISQPIEACNIQRPSWTRDILHNWREALKTEPNSIQHPSTTSTGPSDAPIDYESRCRYISGLVEDVIRERCLNEEQALPLWILKAHILGERAGKAKILLLGQGGTGKSLTIRAIQDLADRLRMEHIVGALWGSAAANLESPTLHSLLGLRSQKQSRVKIQKAIGDAKILIIDEISVIGLRTLGHIEERLEEYFDKGQEKGIDALHTILAGDFLQHDPVGDDALWKPYFPSSNKRIITGFQIWRSFRDVVILRKTYRTQDPDLLHVLNALRGEDVEDLQEAVRLLNERVLEVPRNATWIVHDNNERRATLSHLSQSTYPDALKIPAHDLVDGTQPSRLFTKYLNILSESTFGNLRPSLSLKVGMPAVLISNINTKGNMANGSPVTITKIFDDVIIVRGRHNLRFQGLEQDEFPVFRSTFSTKITLCGRKISISRTQFPLWEGHVITCHKSQGRRICPLATNLRNSRSFAGIYVALSRASKLKDIYITEKVSLEDINKNKPPKALSTALKEFEKRFQTLWESRESLRYSIYY